MSQLALFDMDSFRDPVAERRTALKHEIAAAKKSVSYLSWQLRQKGLTHLRRNQLREQYSKALTRQQNAILRSDNFEDSLKKKKEEIR